MAPCPAFGAPYSREVTFCPAFLRVPKPLAAAKLAIFGRTSLHQQFKFAIIEFFGFLYNVVISDPLQTIRETLVKS